VTNQIEKLVSLKSKNRQKEERDNQSTQSINF